MSGSADYEDAVVSLLGQGEFPIARAYLRAIGVEPSHLSQRLDYASRREETTYVAEVCPDCERMFFHDEDCVRFGEAAALGADDHSGIGEDDR